MSGNSSHRFSVRDPMGVAQRSKLWSKVRAPSFTGVTNSRLRMVKRSSPTCKAGCIQRMPEMWASLSCRVSPK